MKPPENLQIIFPSWRGARAISVWKHLKWNLYYQTLSGLLFEMDHCVLWLWFFFSFAHINGPTARIKKKKKGLNRCQGRWDGWVVIFFFWTESQLLLSSLRGEHFVQATAYGTCKRAACRLIVWDFILTPWIKHNLDLQRPGSLCASILCCERCKLHAKQVSKRSVHVKIPGPISIWIRVTCLFYYIFNPLEARGEPSPYTYSATDSVKDFHRTR